MEIELTTYSLTTGETFEATTDDPDALRTAFALAGEATVEAVAGGVTFDGGYTIDADAWLDLAEALSEIDADVFRGWMNVRDERPFDRFYEGAEAYVEAIRDAYAGQADSVAELGWQTAEAMGLDLDTTLGRYFDAEAFGRDLVIGDYDYDEATGHYFTK